jgi:ADP-heptose:LPS heptosyltransferase
MWLQLNVMESYGSVSTHPRAFNQDVAADRKLTQWVSFQSAPTHITTVLKKPPTLESDTPHSFAKTQMTRIVLNGTVPVNEPGRRTKPPSHNEKSPHARDSKRKSSGMMNLAR